MGMRFLLFRCGCCGHQEREERVRLQQADDVQRGQARLVLVEAHHRSLDAEPGSEVRDDPTHSRRAQVGPIGGETRTACL